MGPARVGNVWEYDMDIYAAVNFLIPYPPPMMSPRDSSAVFHFGFDGLREILYPLNELFVNIDTGGFTLSNPEAAVLAKTSYFNKHA
jgi:hypothetical protein